MESVAYINDVVTKRKSRSCTRTRQAMVDQSLQATPKERLHTVEEFVEKLEQAVLERL